MVGKNYNASDAWNLNPSALLLPLITLYSRVVFLSSVLFAYFLFFHILFYPFWRISSNQINADNISIHSMIHVSCGTPRPSANIETIKGLSSPYFPLDVAREFVMASLNEAVNTNQVHNRDPIGGSNENLFV